MWLGKAGLCRCYLGIILVDNFIIRQSNQIFLVVSIYGSLLEPCEYPLMRRPVSILVFSPCGCQFGTLSKDEATLRELRIPTYLHTQFPLQGSISI